MKMSRAWAMPSHETFSIPPISAFVARHARGTIVDPFARNSRIATIGNDLNPDTSAAYHMDAEDFLAMLARDGVKADTVIFDPPYSPRQIAEVYQQIGRKATMEDTQSAVLYRDCREAIMGIMKPNSVVLSFGWNSSGMGVKRGFEVIEILFVAHGGAHNDTICVAEQLRQGNLFIHTDTRSAP